MANEDEVMGVLKVVMVLLRAMLIPKVHLAAENLALRQQLAVCRKSIKRPLNLHPFLTPYLDSSHPV